jgi:hypothetical protein
VQIDEAWADDPPRRVQHLRCVHIVRQLPDRGDQLPGYGSALPQSVVAL